MSIWRIGWLKVSMLIHAISSREEHQGRLAYYIPITDTKWSSMFDIMESGKSALSIESYSLSQTSLEQVFLSFTKYQREETGPQP